MWLYDGKERFWEAESTLEEIFHTHTHTQTRGIRLIPVHFMSLVKLPDAEERACRARPPPRTLHETPANARLGIRALGGGGGGRPLCHRHECGTKITSFGETGVWRCQRHTNYLFITRLCIVQAPAVELQVCFPGWSILARRSTVAKAPNPKAASNIKANQTHGPSRNPIGFPNILVHGETNQLIKHRSNCAKHRRSRQIIALGR